LCGESSFSQAFGFPSGTPHHRKEIVKNREEGILQEREELHRTIVQHSPNPIFLVDVDSRQIVDANPATSELLGYPFPELLDLNFGEVDLANREGQDLILSRAVEHHHDFLGERVFRRRDGTGVPVEVIANLMIFRGKKVLCLFARDISAKRESDRETQRLHRALVFSQRHEAVGRLAAGIAHDFNNQLMVILLCAQLVEKSLRPDDPILEELEELMAAGKSAGDLVRQLLAFSGKQLLQPKLFNLDETLNALEKMVRRIIGEDIRLDIAGLDAPDATIFADPTQIEQVILNLVVNARDAMPNGGTLTLSTSQVELGEDFVEDFSTLSSGTHLLIRVSDSGTGMSPETLDRIFEPFFTTKGPGSGTGLGLATVYGIVKQSRGSIWAKSEEGAGTTFLIYLPVSDEVPQEVSEIDVPEVRDLPGGKETILVVEDDEMVRMVTARILRDLGYSVLTASGPPAALSIFDGNEGGARIDLLLTDVMMPEGSGPSLVKALLLRRGRLKVIFMSGYAAGRGRAEDVFPGRYLFMEKPLSRADLANAVRQTLDS